MKTDGMPKFHDKSHNLHTQLVLHNDAHFYCVAIIGVLLVSTTVICWTPYNMSHSTCLFETNFHHTVECMTMWLAYSNALLDPLIYTFMDRRARKARNELVCRLGNALARIYGRCVNGLNCRRSSFPWKGSLKPKREKAPETLLRKWKRKERK